MRVPYIFIIENLIMKKFYPEIKSELIFLTKNIIERYYNAED